MFGSRVGRSPFGSTSQSQASSFTGCSTTSIPRPEAGLEYENQEESINETVADRVWNPGLVRSAGRAAGGSRLPCLTGHEYLQFGGWRRPASGSARIQPEHLLHGGDAVSVARRRWLQGLLGIQEAKRLPGLAGKTVGRFANK